MSKKIEEIQKRHTLIKNIISSHEIYNQTQLAKALKQKKVTVTQATLSRDLTELGVLRIPTADGLVYKLGAMGDEAALKNKIAEEIISVGANESLVVVKTYPGRAQGVAVLLDRKSDLDILGTLAGDDTIIVIPKSINEIKKAFEQIKAILGIK